jgi:tetratricopeptide (TPR) repeat protein
MNEASAGNRWRPWLAGLAIVMLAAAALGIYLWPRATPVPDIPLDGQEPEVAKVINAAHEETVQQPRSADAWGKLGRVLVANEFQVDIALACFQEAERLDPGNPRWPYFASGLLSVDKGLPQQALPKLERAVALGEGNIEAPSAPRLRLAETLLQLGQDEQARGQYLTVLRADPDNPRAHFGLGQIAAAAGDWQDSRTHLEACLSSPEARQKASVQLATVCERLGDKENAAKYATFAARMPKDFDWTDPYVVEHTQYAVRKRDRYKAVEGLEAQGQFGEAASLLARLVADNPDDYLPHLMLGRVLPQMGQLDKAEEHLLAAKRLSPDKIQVHYLLSLVYFHQGETITRQKNGDPQRAQAFFEKAAQAAREVLAHKPDYGFAHMSLGLALKQLGQPEESLAELREAVHCNPEYADNHLFLGEALAASGDTAQARRHLEQAQLLANPNDPRPKAALDKLP